MYFRILSFSSSLSTGNRISTRRSRFLGIQSALPMYISSLPSFSKIKIRACSRNSPTMERTSIFSESPGIPAFRQQIPRTTRWILTPAQDASYKAAMISLSQREFIFAIMEAGFPARAFFVSRSIRRRNFVLSHSGATESIFQFKGSE